MRWILLLMSMLVSNITHLAAKSKEVIISGYIQKELFNFYGTNELIIRIKRTTHSSSTGEYFRAPISADGSFKTIINDSGPLFYIAFEFEDKTSGTFFNVCFPKDRTLKEVYLMQEGDRITVDIQKEGNMRFTGKGSEKLNCEWQMYNIPAVPLSIERRVLDNNNITSVKSKLSILDNALDLAIKNRLLILDSYRGQLSGRIYNLLYMDILGSAQHSLSSKIVNFPTRVIGKDKKEILKYYQEKLLDVISKLKDTDLAAESAYYTEMLYEQEYDIHNFSGTGSFQSEQSFSSLYNKLKNSYEGKLRDKLILISFERAGYESKSLINDALTTTQDTIYKNLLSALNRKRNTAFPFEFYDGDNKVHKLSDYREKVVILETWFYGCIPCKALSKAMQPIFEKYRNNKNIVFLTVGTDQMDYWIRGIASGQYSHRGMIELHTNGEGFKNPLFAHYNFQGAPHQLIIGKQGRLIAIDPPRPVDTESIQAFKKIIDDNLSAEH